MSSLIPPDPICLPLLIFKIHFFKKKTSIFVSDIFNERLSHYRKKFTKQNVEIWSRSWWKNVRSLKFACVSLVTFLTVGIFLTLRFPPPSLPHYLSFRVLGFVLNKVIKTYTEEKICRFLFTCWEIIWAGYIRARSVRVGRAWVQICLGLDSKWLNKQPPLRNITALR